MFDESHADHVGSADGQCRRCHRANSRSSDRHAFYHAGHSQAGGRRNHRSGEARYNCLAAVLRKRNVENLRNDDAAFGFALRRRRPGRRPAPEEVRQPQTIEKSARPASVPAPCVRPGRFRRRPLSRLKRPASHLHGLRHFRQRLGDPGSWARGLPALNDVRPNGLRQALLTHDHAACLMPTIPSTSLAIAAISRAASPFQLMRLGVAPQRPASA